MSNVNKDVRVREFVGVDSIKDIVIATNYLISLKIAEYLEEQGDRSCVSEIFMKLLGDDLKGNLSTQLLLNSKVEGDGLKNLCENIIGKERIDWVESTYTLVWESLEDKEEVIP